MSGNISLVQLRLRLKAFPHMLIHHISLQFYEVNMSLCLPYASIQCGLRQEGMGSWSVLIAHLEYIYHLTHFYAAAFLNTEVWLAYK